MNPKDLVGAKKAPLSLVPPSAIIAMAEAMQVGADKYGPFNWRDQPVQVRTYVEAALRHLYAFLDGQEAAEDTKVSHLAHAMAGLAILNDAIELGAIDDNRSKGPAAGLLRRQDKSVNPGDLQLGPPDLGAMTNALILEANRQGMYISVTTEPLPPTYERWGDGDGQVVEVGRNVPFRDVNPVVWDEAGSSKLADFVAAWEAMKDAPPPTILLHSAPAFHEGPIPGPNPSVQLRGEWPPDTRVGGLLTCCGQSEHPLDCPHYR